MLRKEIESQGDRIQFHNILDTPPEGWKGLKGYVNEEVLKSICPLDDPDTLYLYCGPPPMTQIVRGLFQDKYPKSIFLKF